MLGHVARDAVAQCALQKSNQCSALFISAITKDFLEKALKAGSLDSNPPPGGWDNGANVVVRDAVPEQLLYADLVPLQRYPVARGWYPSGRR